MSGNTLFELKINTVAYTEKLWEMLSADTSYDPDEILARISKAEPLYLFSHVYMVQKIVRFLHYNKRAVERYAEEFYKDSSATVDEINRRRANYERFYYEESCIAEGKKPSRNRGDKLWQEAYEILSSHDRKIRGLEKEAIEEVREIREEVDEKRNKELREALSNLETAEPPDVDEEELVRNLNNILLELEGDLEERDKIADMMDKSKRPIPRKERRALERKEKRDEKRKKKKAIEKAPLPKRVIQL